MTGEYRKYKCAILKEKNHNPKHPVWFKKPKSNDYSFSLLKVNSELISEVVENSNYASDFLSQIKTELIDELYNFYFGKKLIFIEKTNYDKLITYDKLLSDLEIRILIMNNGNYYIIFS